MQYRKGLLDTTSEEKLDLVDGLVFDITVDQRIRDEAFRFVLDHTEGFDEQDLIEFDFKTHNKRKKHRLSAGTDVESMEKKKRIALQIETLTEFAEHHLSNSRYSQASHLAVACLHSPFYCKKSVCFLNCKNYVVFTLQISCWIGIRYWLFLFARVKT